MRTRHRSDNPRPGAVNDASAGSSNCDASTADTAGAAPTRSKVVRASAWVLGGDAAGRVVQLASHLILAWLLFPEAFGLIARGEIFLRELQSFSDIGLGACLIHSPSGEDPRFRRTAWTLQVIRGFILWMIALLIAGGLWGAVALNLLAADQTYAHPLLPPLLAVAAFSAVFQGFQSTAEFVLGRRLVQRKVVSLQVGSQLAGTATIVAWAWLYPTVWAFVGGMLVSSIFRTVSSHFLDRNHRDRFGWDSGYAREILRFSKWIPVSTLLLFFQTRGYALLLAAFLTPAQLGLFYIGRKITGFVSRPIHRVSTRVVFPVYARLMEGGSKDLRAKVTRIRLVFMALSIPTLATLVLFGQTLVDLVYDERYTDAGWMLRVLAAGVLFAPLNLPDTVLLSTGDTYRLAILRGVTTGLTLTGLLVGGLLFGVSGLIVGAAVGPRLNYPVVVWAIRRYGVWSPLLDGVRFAVGVVVSFTALFTQ